MRLRQSPRDLPSDLDAESARIWALFDRMLRLFPSEDRRNYELQACRDAVLDALALAHAVVERHEKETRREPS